MDPQFGSAIIRLAEVAENARNGAHVKHSAVALFPHMLPSGSGHHERSFHMDQLDQLPVLDLHLMERLVPQNARIVYDDIHSSEGPDRIGDDLVPELHGIVVGEGGAAQGSDFVSDDVGHSPRVLRLRCDLEADVVDDDLGAARGEVEGDGAADASAGACDYCDSAVESNLVLG